jgi:peptide/nickel transport system permease protein
MKLVKMRFTNVSLHFGLIIISLYLLLMMGGAWFRIDKSINSNQIYPEIKNLPLWSTVDILHSKRSGLTIINWINGGVEPYSIYEKVEILHSTNSNLELIDSKGKKTKIDLESTTLEVSRFLFPLGTDKYGRCLWSRIHQGISISLLVGFVSVIIALIIGLVLGLLAGYFGGRLDDLISWFINVVWSVPTILMVIAITLALGKGVVQIFIAVGLTMWVETARVVRGQIKTFVNKEFVEAGKALGFQDFKIIFSHILPNILGPITVIAASNFSTAILLEAGLSFLGLGAQPPVATWGSLIRDHYGFMFVGKAHLTILPGLAIIMLVFGFMLLSDGLRQVYDYKGDKKSYI